MEADALFSEVSSGALMGRDIKAFVVDDNVEAVREVARRFFRHPCADLKTLLNVFKRASGLLPRATRLHIDVLAAKGTQYRRPSHPTQPDSLESGPVCIGRLCTAASRRKRISNGIPNAIRKRYAPLADESPMQDLSIVSGRFDEVLPRLI